LSQDEAQRRLERYGPNALPEARPDPLWLRFARQFKSPLIYILLFALAVDLSVWWVQAHGGLLPWEGLAIGVILLLNAALGVWQEYKAEGAVAKLKHLSAPQVWTLRDGRLLRLASRALVPGDLVRLESGDRVPADAVARIAENLMLDESVLTGESLPVDKEPTDELFAGTLVARGKTYAEVTRTGAHSAMGRLAEVLEAVTAERTPLERRLEGLGHRVARWMIALAALVALGGIWAEGWERAGHALLFAVALAVAAVPEGLPAVLSVTLALGVERMARRRAAVRRLTSVEALGSVTVIATDKTGTLTENRMEVRDLVTPDHEQALRAMILANDAEPGLAVGDPLERALLDYAHARLGDVEAVRRAFARASVRGFDSATKFMRATVRENGGLISYVKGAPEVMLDRCVLPEDDRSHWRRRVHEYAEEGYRVLGLARGRGEREDDLQWLGLVLLWDPPRAEVAGAVAQAQAAGIRVLMITGDHPATAQTVARTVGIPVRRVMTGADLERLSPVELRRIVGETDVFARVSPEQKLGIVEALKAEGEIVAVTGDGVNDAPALKRADVGVAMGQRGSEVAREVADLVLLDDNFATIVAAVEEGRSIYENIRKFIRFLFSTNVSEILVVTLGAAASILLGLRDAAGQVLLPLTAAQLLWINLVTDGAPALALGLDRNPGVMQRLPRNPAAPLLDRQSLLFVLFSGCAKALIAFGILGLLPLLLRQSTDATRTATFLFLGAGQLLFAYAARRTDLQPTRNPAVHAAVLVGFALQIAVVSLPVLMRAFNAVPLPPGAWVWVLGSVALTWGIAEATSRLVWVRGEPVSRRAES
jgi:Ca2+-transporting ATPase